MSDPTGTPEPAPPAGGWDNLTIVVLAGRALVAVAGPGRPLQ